MEIYQKSIPYTNALLRRKVRGPAVLDIAGAEYVGRANMLAEAGHQVTLIDLHDPWGELHDNVNFIKLRVEKLNPEVGLFDDVLLSNALEHFDSPETALNAIKKVLKPDSLLHILTPNRESLNRRVGVLMGCLESMESIPDKEVEIGHKHTFSVGSMTALLTKASFKVTCCQGIFLKPVPTPEMIKWPEARIKAFFDIASQLPPELSHEVYFQATLL